MELTLIAPTFRFTDAHGFQKPNDDRGLNLMNKSAEMCMRDINDIVLAYGQSDEFRSFLSLSVSFGVCPTQAYITILVSSFVLKKNTTLYNRRSR